MSSLVPFIILRSSSIAVAHTLSYTSSRLPRRWPGIAGKSCYSFDEVWLLVGERFCQAININRNGMVMTAVVIKMGCKEVGSILMPNI